MSEVSAIAILANEGLAAVSERVTEAIKSGDMAQVTPVLNDLLAMEYGLGRILRMVKTAVKSEIMTKGTTVTDAGSKELRVGEWTIPLISQGGGSGTLDDRKVESKLRAKGIPTDAGMVATVRYTASRSKLLALALSGKWTAQDFKDCEQEQKWALHAPKKVNVDE
jgi:hypothetical protein